MPHWAEIDKNNIVLRVTYGEGTDEESHKWLIDNLGGTWVRTYYNTPPNRYAGIGFKWHEDKKNFSAPQPYPSWVLDDNLEWQPPVPQPTSGGPYIWNESTNSWKTLNG